MSKDTIIQEVADYYTEKLQLHGASSKGVDWNSVESQEIRFEQLLKVIQVPSEEKFSVLDYGCGFGAMFPYMDKKYYYDFRFIGYDISKEMLQKAQELYGNHSNTAWVDKTEVIEPVDFTLASGIFNVRLDYNDKIWESYILDTLHKFDKLSTKGFAFNMLTSYSDKEYMKKHLYYANPTFFFDYCKTHFSKHVAVMHDYPLYEFTILVRKY